MVCRAAIGGAAVVMQRVWNADETEIESLSAARKAPLAAPSTAAMKARSALLPDTPIAGVPDQLVNAEHFERIPETGVASDGGCSEAQQGHHRCADEICSRSRARRRS
jgi:hypothetical protein